MSDRPDNNILYEAFEDIDPALAARSETGASFAKNSSGRNAGDNNRGRNLLPLVIIPVALIAAITAMVIISNNNNKRHDHAPVGMGTTPEPSAETNVIPATDDPTTAATDTPTALPTDTPTAPPEGTLLYAIDAFMCDNGFSDIVYSDSLDDLAVRFGSGGKTLKELGGFDESSSFDEPSGDFSTEQHYTGDKYYIQVSHAEQSKMFDSNIIAVINTLWLRSNIGLEGLELPFGIRYGDSIADVLAKMGLALPDEGSFGAGELEVLLDSTQDTGEFGVNAYSLKLVDYKDDPVVDAEYSYEIVFVFSSVQQDLYQVGRSVSFSFYGNSLIDSALAEMVIMASDADARVY